MKTTKNQRDEWYNSARCTRGNPRTLFASEVIDLLDDLDEAMATMRTEPARLHQNGLESAIVSLQKKLDSALASAEAWRVKCERAEKTKSETAWLIEKKVPGYPACFWTGSQSQWWSESASDAMRFSREQDAELARSNFVGLDDFPGTYVADHMWCSGSDLAGAVRPEPKGSK